jgi:hypothetical protein
MPSAHSAACDRAHGQHACDPLVCISGVHFLAVPTAIHAATLKAHATQGGTPVLHHISDFAPGLSVADASKVVVAFTHDGTVGPKFGVHGARFIRQSLLC